MFIINEMIGKKFGEWTVLSFSHTDGNGRYYLCRCSCGFEKVNHGSHLRRGMMLRCRECRNKLHRNKGHGMKNTSTWRIWMGIKARCLNPTDKAFKNYGGRGITVCDKWINFLGFYEDMGLRPEGLEIDRIDNNAGYSKENCKWVTRKENSNNRRNTPKDIDIVGKTYGEWFVIKPIEDKPRYYLCRCSCGLERIQWVFSLLYEKSKSCKSCGIKAGWIGRSRILK